MTAGLSALIERRYSRFNLCRNLRRRAAAEMRFHLEAIKRRGIVTGGNHDAAHELSAANLKRNVGRRIRPIHHEHSKAIRRKHFGGGPSEGFRLESNVVADEHAGLATFDGLE